MKFVDIERFIDLARSDRERVFFLERVIPLLRGPELRSALIVLANKYFLLKKFKNAAELYALVGFHSDAVKALARL